MSKHDLAPDETDVKLLAAHTPTSYVPPYPWYVNFTMVRMKGDVVLTVRAETVLPPSMAMEGREPGETRSIRLTREMWPEFVKMVKEADVIWRACDNLDGIL